MSSSSSSDSSLGGGGSSGSWSSSTTTSGGHGTQLGSPLLDYFLHILALQLRHHQLHLLSVSLDADRAENLLDAGFGNLFPSEGSEQGGGNVTHFKSGRHETAQQLSCRSESSNKSL